MISPFADKLKEVGIAQFADLALWKPQVGDFVFFNGWIKHWFGIVISVQPGEVEIIHDILPVNVFTMGPNEQKKKAVKLDLRDFHKSKGGKYAVLQVTGGQTPIFFLR